jgi:hypothetical protein
MWRSLQPYGDTISQQDSGGHNHLPLSKNAGNTMQPLLLMKSLEPINNYRLSYRRLLPVVGMLVSLLSTTAQAEWYVGAYGGLSYPGPFSNVTLSDPALAGGISGARVNDLELKSALAGGVKAGYFFTDRPWLGLEKPRCSRWHQTRSSKMSWAGKQEGQSSLIPSRKSPFGSRRGQLMLSSGHLR